MGQNEISKKKNGENGSVRIAALSLFQHEMLLLRGGN
jgi:hypothetical protein